MLSTEKNDRSLVREYVERRSEAAFETLVQRHLDMVYSAAWRQAGDADLAEEVVQAVFVLLARKAAHLREGVVVAGWLYRTACLTAHRALRDQTRRRIKDREAAEMRLTDSDEEVWSRLMPHLDSALANLGELDRTAIVLRFLERRSFRDVAVALSVSEDAAKKRVTRALEKLRLVFSRHGVTLGLSAIVAALSTKAVKAAPEDLLRASVQAGLSGGMVAGPGVGALVASVVKEALISRLKWAAALVGVGIFLAMIITLYWLNSSSGRPKDLISALPTNPTRGAVRIQPGRLARPAPAPDTADNRAMTLRVIADESDQPLADVVVHVEFIIMPKSVLSTFVTDAAGTASIVLPTNSIDGMNCWVSALGRVPMTVSWNTKASMDSLAPDYTLRLPQGRLVAGMVVDETGESIAGASVHFQGEGMRWDSREFADYEGPMSLPQSERLPAPVTDANGHWSADFISPHAKSLFGYLEHPEFATTQFGHIHPPDPVEPSTNLVLVLERGVSVAGTVRDTAGMPISEAQVNLSDHLGLPARWTKTDAAGHFEFPRVGDEQNAFLSVRANGFRFSGELPIQSRAGTNFDIVLKAFGVAGNSIIRGRVVSLDGKSIAGAEVGLAPGQAGLEDINWGMRTDAEGRFAWTAAPDYPVKLVIRGSNWDWEEQQAELAPNGAEAVITLKPKARIRLHGTVSDKLNGSLLPEFKVLWAPGIKRGYVVNTSVLIEGRDGRFTVNLLPEQVRNYSPPGTSARLDFQASGYVNKVVSLVSGTNDIDLEIQLEPAMDIAGEVLQPDGKPAVGARVFIRGEHFRFRVGENCFVSMPEYPFAVDTRAGLDGAFRIAKIDGIERLEVVHPKGWANVALDRRSTASIQLQPWGRLLGVVRSDQGVLPGVEVRVTEAGTGPEQMLFEFIVKTDSEGRFEFSQVPGGRTQVSLPVPEDGQTTNRVTQEIQVEPLRTASLTLSVQAH